MRLGKYQPPENLALSIEEAAILVDEINQDTQDVVTTMVETNTAVDVTNIFEDARKIERDFDNVEMLALSDIVTELGANITGTVTIVDYTPTIESISDHIRNGWKKIVELLKKAWQFLVNFFTRIFKYRDYLRHRVSQLRAKVGTLEDQPTQANPTINVPMRDGKIFTSSGKKLIDTSSFQQVLRDIFKNVRNNFKQGPVAINAVGEGFMTSVKAVTPTATKDELEKVFATTIVNQLWRYFDAFGIKDFKRESIESRTTNHFTATSEPIAGSARIAFTWGNAMNQFFMDRSTPGSLAEVIRDLTIARCNVVQDREVTPSNHLTMPAFKHGGMLAALSEVEKGLDLIDQLESDHHSKMHDFSDKFGKVAHEVSQRFEGNVDAANDNRAIFNTMLNLPVLYANLSTQPLMDLTKRTTGTLEAVINMVDASTRMYAPKAA